jgi:hypothetical protein
MIPYSRLSQIIPADQALANKALATALQQVAGIPNLTLSTFANVVVNLQTTLNLPLITSLTTPVPPNVANYLSNIAGSSGTPVGVCDVLGIAAGYQVAGNFANTTSTLANTNVVYLTTVYQTMNSVVGNVYGDPDAGPIVIPGGQPAAGTYTAVTDTDPMSSTFGNVITPASVAAFSGSGGDTPPTGPGLIPVAQTEIGNILGNNPNQVASLNSYFNSMAQQVVQENVYQTQSQIDFGNLVPNNAPSIYSLVYSLPTYGTQTEIGGSAQFWEGVANVNTFTGQAIIGTMREGKNQAFLNNAGIATNSAVPADPIPPLPPAPLIPSTYTEQQAANLLVR